ncbi:MAG TPA: UDP-N-acetylmuramoyl-L-alanyl-D-glutamate--2,6-diaminopimelate ligase [Acidimicrobiia bacterium]|nr:UDP-N-acetylmuramoyl-L-alanyl-D-glutamate--2,6-diaminopimelate ligase [Acidimicrobiia bacterium]
MDSLGALVAGEVIGDPSVVVEGITHDSRSVSAGDLYVALRGANFDGHEYLDQAVRSGAVAVCVDHATAVRASQLVVEDPRSVMGDLAASIYDDPSHSLKVIGVTGTNGKTTVTHFIESIAQHAGKVTGLVGTIHTRYAGVTLEATMTTPEAPEFQRLLATMRDAGVSIVAAEVSSHALELGRVRATRFDVAAFTNLSQDHLDFHGDMESYRRAKERLFSEYEVGTAVFNIDDPVGAGLAADYEGRALTVGPGGSVSIHNVASERGGTRLHIETPDGGMDVAVPIVGEFNLSNLAMAVACCLGAGIAFSDIAEAVPGLRGVPGRFEVVSGDDPITVVVDYAHTPEAVARAVNAGRQLTGRRVIALLGAGGDRDRAKRPAMGGALSTADLAIVTSDNPRTEDPSAIIASVVAGIPDGSNTIVEVDRRTAIEIAIDAAEDGDVVLILGKGHEPYQQIGSERLAFDDRDVAATVLHQRRSSTESNPESGSITS